jgi:hypothetical protein
MKESTLAVILATPCALVVAVSTQSPSITIVLTGQSMVRSDLRATKPAALAAMKGLLSVMGRPAAVCLTIAHRPISNA